MDKIQLECVLTHGRWNKGDKAVFPLDMARGMIAGEGAMWREIGPLEAEPDEAEPDEKPSGKKSNPAA